MSLTNEAMAQLENARVQANAIHRNGDLSQEAKQRKSYEVMQSARTSIEGTVRSRYQAAEKKLTSAVKEMREGEEAHESRLNFTRLQVNATELSALVRTAEPRQVAGIVENTLVNGDYYRVRGLISALPDVHARTEALEIGERAFVGGLGNRIDARMRELEPATLQLSRKDATTAEQEMKVLVSEVRGIASLPSDLTQNGRWNGLYEAAGMKAPTFF